MIGNPQPFFHDCLPVGQKRQNQGDDHQHGSCDHYKFTGVSKSRPEFLISYEFDIVIKADILLLLPSVPICACSHKIPG